MSAVGQTRYGILMGISISGCIDQQWPLYYCCDTKQWMSAKSQVRSRYWEYPPYSNAKVSSMACQSREETLSVLTLVASTGNQSIECWWCMLRSECAKFWMDPFWPAESKWLFCWKLHWLTLTHFCIQKNIQIQYPLLLYQQRCRGDTFVQALAKFFY